MAAQAPRYSDWLGASDVAALGRGLDDPKALADLRSDAFRSFLELPLEPDPLYRRYGYFAGVDLSGIAPGDVGARIPEPPVPESTVVAIHDGAGSRVHVPEALRDSGVRVETYPELVRSGHTPLETFLRGTEAHADRLTALAIALLNRGYRLEIPDRLPGAVRLKDVVVLDRAHEALSVRRSIRVGHESRLLASEEVYTRGTLPEAQRMYGSATDLDLADGAHTAFLTVHAPDTRTVSLYNRHATTGPGARLGWVWTGFGGFRTRLRNRTSLPGNGSQVEDLQAFYGAQNQAYDSSVGITHIGTDTHGQSITRGVFKDESRGMSRGLVRIEKDARRTLSYLSEHAILLSRGARSDTIPVLEILCRDVKATHSTSVAPVDPEKVFYLESRGLTTSDAIRMIGEGFLSHVLERAPFAELRDTLYPYLAARWDGRSLDWGDGRQIGLPPLEFRGGDSATDWRFDAKLR